MPYQQSFQNSTPEAYMHANVNVNSEGLGHFVRRIMFTNSGSYPVFRPAAADLAPPNCRMLAVTNVEWERLTNAAKSAMETGNLGQAEAMWLKALAEAKQFHDQDPRLLFTFEQLGRMYFALGHYEQSELFWTRALNLSINTQGNFSLKVGNCLEALARVHCRQQRFADAEALLLRQVAIYEKELGPTHPWLAVAVNNLAKLFRAQGKLQRALHLYEKAVANFSTRFSAENEEITSLLANYRSLLKQMNAADDSVKRIVGRGERTTRIKLPVELYCGNL